MLSAKNYLKNNRKRAAILIISFGLYFALLYGVQFFLQAMMATEEAVSVTGKDRMQCVFVGRGDLLPIDTTLWEEESNATEKQKIAELNQGVVLFAEELEKDPKIDAVIPCATYGIRINSFTGSSYYRIPLVLKEEVKQICDYNHVTLLQGDYPKEPGDILIDERMAKNRGFHLGEPLFEDSYRVCGIASANSYFGVGIPIHGQIVKRHLLFLDQGYITSISDYFAKMGIEASKEEGSDIEIIWDIRTGKENVAKSYDDLELPMNIMIYVFTFVLGITLYIVYHLHIKERYEEWCLYRSLGYSKQDIFQMAFCEFLICLAFGIMLAVVSIGIIIVIGINLMESKGVAYQIFLPDKIKQIIAIMVCLTGILQIPVVTAMRHITTVDAMEEDV